MEERGWDTSFNFLADTFNFIQPSGGSLSLRASGAREIVARALSLLSLSLREVLNVGE